MMGMISLIEYIIITIIGYKLTGTINRVVKLDTLAMFKLSVFFYGGINFILTLGELMINDGGNWFNNVPDLTNLALIFGIFIFRKELIVPRKSDVRKIMKFIMMIWMLTFAINTIQNILILL